MHQTELNPLLWGEKAARVGLTLNAGKYKTLRTQHARSSDNIAGNGEQVDETEEFLYLRAKVDREGWGSRYIDNRIQKARGALQGLWKVWKTRGIGWITKIHLFKTLVRPVLVYGCETWKINKVHERKMNHSKTSVWDE